MTSRADLVESIAGSTADSDGFRIRAARLFESAQALGLTAPTRSQLEVVSPLIACDAPALRLIQRPRLVRWLARTRFLEEERPADSFSTLLDPTVKALDASDVEGFDRLLRSFRHREMLRIALRDLTRRAPTRVVVRELSNLADALTNAAVFFWDRLLTPPGAEPLGERFCVVAVGKHGGQELNYSSDIDVLFVFDARCDDPTARDRALGIAQGVIKSLSAPTARGIAFRVDANLRPWGRAGPLVQSVDEMERYYERAGQTWERAALIKARACAGHLPLGDEFIERVRPFVWRRSLDLAAVEAIAAMKQRMDRVHEQSPSDDVKLGRGGIREIEFFVQALQLLHGGRQPGLRVQGTFEALDALLYAGIISSIDHDALTEAYAFLRDVEHRVQVPDDRQTHRVPADGEKREQLARRMDFDSWTRFEPELARQRTIVREHFAALLETAADELPHRTEVDVALAVDEPDDVRERALDAMGFESPEQARAELDRLTRQMDGAFGPLGREKHPGLSERLLEEMTRAPSPDQALGRFALLAGRLWHPAALTSLLASNAATARLLILLFSSSEALTRDFQMHPEMLDALVRSDAAALLRTRLDLESEVSDRLSRRPELEDALALLRRIRHEETLRIGLHDLAGRLSSVEVGSQLTQVGEVLIAHALELAKREVMARFGKPAESTLAVLGLGSFGAHELDYESDLDLVFVHDASGPTSGGSRGTTSANEWVTRVFQRLLSHLTIPTAEGVLYRVDARLRPSGTQGTLVTSFDAFRSYHQGEHARGAALWERQALLRARVVAGDAEFAKRIEDEVLLPSSQRPLPDDAAQQISQVRRRLDEQSPGKVSPKRGPGGLLDIDFITQYLSLVHGLRVPSTRVALDALEEAEALDYEDARSLREAWEKLKRTESRLRLMQGQPDVWVPETGPTLLRLARSLGDANPDAGERLLRIVKRTMRSTRVIFDRLVPGA